MRAFLGTLVTSDFAGEGQKRKASYCQESRREIKHQGNQNSVKTCIVKC